MKKNIVIMAFLLIVSALSAQSSGESKALLDKAYTAYETSNGIRLSFKSTLTEEDGTAYAPQQGEAYIRGDKFKIELETMDIWFDGKTQWVLMKEVNEVNISSPSGSEIASISPLALLGIYKSGFILKAPVPGTINGKSVSLINMVPATHNKDFKSITAAVEKQTGNIVQVTFIQTGGAKNVIDVFAYNTNHQFGDEMFRFDKKNHPDVEIVDLR